MKPGCPYSKEKINKAGRLLSYGQGSLTDAEEESAYAVVNSFRASHQQPLTSLVTGLRSMVRCESQMLVVAQRLKRTPQVLAKLSRFPKMSLSRMEDVGGCRAVLADGAEVEAVLGRICGRWNVKRPPRDYVSRPKSSGYRAQHVVVLKNDRSIEIQLRTTGQQAWANMVEALASKFDLPLKDDSGPAEVLEYLQLASEGIYMDEQGIPIGADFEKRWNDAELRMRHWTELRRDT